MSQPRNVTTSLQQLQTCQKVKMKVSQQSEKKNFTTALWQRSHRQLCKGNQSQQLQKCPLTLQEVECWGLFVRGFKGNLLLIGLLCVQTDKLGTWRIQTPSHPSHHPSWAFTWGINALGYDSFSDVGENRVYFASKILTPCRMHWNAFLIAQIIAKCHSFPNM